jgi:hypothetical protein
VLPILHLNGFKIANPTVLARISREELTELLRGYGYDPHFVEGDDPGAGASKPCRDARHDPGADPQIQSAARSAGATGRRRAPALADDRVSHAQGLDRARNSSTACRSKAPGARIRCRSRTSRIPSISSSSKTG